MVELNDAQFQMALLYPSLLNCPKCNHSFCATADESRQDSGSQHEARTKNHKTRRKRAKRQAERAAMGQPETRVPQVLSETRDDDSFARVVVYGSFSLIGLVFFLVLFNGNGGDGAINPIAPPSGMTPSPVRVNQFEYDMAYRKFRDAGLNANDAKTATDAVKRSVESKYR